MNAADDESTWRDEQRLPASELKRAMGVYATDGQADDATANDASAEQTFGESAAESTAAPAGGQDMTDDEYAAHAPEPEQDRPSPHGRLGPD